MRDVAEKMIKTHRMEGPDGVLVAINSEISYLEGLFLEEVILDIKPKVTLEIGVAFGVSSLFICGAMARTGGEKHIAIDIGPIKKENSDELDRFGLALYNLARCGYGQLVEPRVSPSEISLPDLLRHGQRIQFAFIDGWHSFDHTLVDFFYVNKMLDVGGVVAFHDTVHPNVAKVVRHVQTYPSYRLYGHARKPQPLFSTSRKGIERFIAYLLFLMRRLKPSRPNCVALQKVAEDHREWTWFKDF
ncbi:MAG: class I SAM-dependent methyltransferase [Syntrophobacterales bacterium]|jgi:predicted O-methyltransferase YrrM|nr:class I SAM-dependent methyltransferase [Syntrophobacterales bacterium]